MARPVYTALDAASSTTVTALVPFTLGDQPEIVPASPAKMKMLLPLTAFCVTLNVGLPLNTMPVGRAGPAEPGGIATTRDCRTPVPSYNVEVELPALATQTKAAGLKATPQPLTRCVSACAPRSGLVALVSSDTRLVSAYAVAAAGVDGLAGAGVPLSPPPPPHAARLNAAEQAAS